MQKTVRLSLEFEIELNGDTREIEEYLRILAETDVAEMVEGDSWTRLSDENQVEIEVKQTKIEIES